MRVVENECVGCSDMGLPCIGEYCPNRHVVRYYCDFCDKEITGNKEPQEFDGKHYCSDCLSQLRYEN